MSLGGIEYQTGQSQLAAHPRGTEALRYSRLKKSIS
jgi:hypothetical protein